MQTIQGKPLPSYATPLADGLLIISPTEADITCQIFDESTNETTIFLGSCANLIQGTQKADILAQVCLDATPAFVIEYFRRIGLRPENEITKH